MKDKKVYVITGATSGIGKGLVKELCYENIVFAGYRSEEKRQELEAISEYIKPFYIDYSKPETIAEAVNYIKSECSHIDTLINVAGCIVAGPVELLSVSEMRKQFDINVFGHIEFTQGLFNLLSDGKIINVSSMASFTAFPYMSSYCASKRCLDMHFDALLVENRNNVKIVSIKPGIMATPLWDKAIKDNMTYEDSECYQKDMKLAALVAQLSSRYGQNPDRVVQTILKADRSESPKLSYTVGFDSFWMRFLSKLPQVFINWVYKLLLKICVR